MTALAAARDTIRLGQDAVPPQLAVPIAASTKLYEGGLCCISAGYAVPGSAAAGLIAAGRSRRTYDNSAGAAGDITAELERGIFRYDNSASTDAITQADVGKLAYIVDDATVARTDGGAAARSVAGPIVAIDSVGVYVQVGATLRPGTAAMNVLAIPLILANIANSDVVARYVPKYPGRIVKVEAMVTIAATTAAKAATLTTKIATVAATGGVLALTSANMTPKGASAAATALTALNEFTAAQEITVEASAVTAFVEGEALLLITLAGQ